ncbi:MAG: hypothetical protein ABL914_02700 [Novosphingobium sp.]|uniref:hypothetical protein n=1 Tax=Novosphingobium sp. TaxID=1874826 RepID=UPI0032B9E86A
MQTFDIGRAFSRTFGLMRDGIGTVGVFLLLATLLGQGIGWGLQWMTVQGLAENMPADPKLAPLAMFASAWYLASLLFSMFAGAFNSAGSITGYLDLAEQRDVSLAGCISAGLAKLLPVLGLSILWTLGIMFGFMLLIVPGVLMLVIWSAALPALIGEGAGVFGAFQRSRDLTRGSRLLVFVFLLLLCVLIYAPLMVFGGALMSGGPEQFAKLSQAGFSPLLIAGSAVYAWAIAMVIGAGLVALYHELIAVEGAGPSTGLTSVFE